MSGGRGKEPERTCLGCRLKKAQSELWRLALARGEGNGLTVVWDKNRVLGGRGAWLCRDKPECLELADKKNAFRRAFKKAVEFSPDSQRELENRYF
ncbi:YlxR family protein [Deltaproteobacteria bacterium OttesenSCG-928-K17]|nr:YlxR family protein [Deltaproteobacteria bacterium OttesenSCG-928-K17]